MAKPKFWEKDDEDEKRKKKPAKKPVKKDDKKVPPKKGDKAKKVPFPPEMPMKKLPKR